MRAEAELVQHLVQQDTGMITRERAPRCIGAVHAGGQADDQQGRIRIAERRHRPAIIIGKTILDLIKESREPRTRAARLVKYAIVQASVVHMANDRCAETARADQRRTWNKLVELLLHATRTLRGLVASWLVNRFAQPRKIES